MDDHLLPKTGKISEEANHKARSFVYSLYPNLLNDVMNTKFNVALSAASKMDGYF